MVSRVFRNYKQKLRAVRLSGNHIEFDTFSDYYEFCKISAKKFEVNGLYYICLNWVSDLKMDKDQVLILLEQARFYEEQVLSINFYSHSEFSVELSIEFDHKNN